MTETFSERLSHANPLQPSLLTKRRSSRPSQKLHIAPLFLSHLSLLLWNQTAPANRAHHTGSCGHAFLSILPFAVTHPQSVSKSSLPRSSLSGAISSGWLLISPTTDHPLTSILLQGGLQMRHTPGYTARRGETCILSGTQEDNVRFQDSALPDKSKNRGPESSRILFSLMSPYRGVLLSPQERLKFGDFPSLVVLLLTVWSFMSHLQFRF